MLDRGGGAASDIGARLWKRVSCSKHAALAIRVAVVLVALAIIYLRTPTTFTNPQFWGEDVELFRSARFDGWSALSNTLAGYLVSAQVLVAVLASYVSPIAAPAIYNYAAVFLTLVVVWLITSPRLHLPVKPLLAIAVVIVPMGYEELGTTTNIQWILPVGAFALLFMDASRSPVVLFGEGILLALTSFSGPFSIFLTPMYVWQLISAQELSQRRRLAALTAIVALGAVTQLWVISHHSDAMYHGAAIPYSPTLWITLPFARILTVFGPVSWVFMGLTGAILGILLFVVAVAFACQRPFRTQKIFMIFFATAIALGGLYKFRVDLASQIYATRYFYIGSVFTLWFICCLFTQPYLRFVFAAIVVVTEIMLLPLVANTPRIIADLEWPVWARYISSGLPMLIPTSPTGWYLDLPPVAKGPLGRFASWQDRDIKQLAEIDPSVCSGTIGFPLPVSVLHLNQPVPEQGKLWTATGLIWGTQQNATPALIAIVDQADRVIGFGLPGFEPRQSTRADSVRSHWIANFFAKPGLTVRAFGLAGDSRRVCPLGDESYLPTAAVPLASDRFVAAIPVVPERVIRQAFEPDRKIVGLMVRFVAWGKRPTPYMLRWRIVGSMPSGDIELGSGQIESTDIHDWQSVPLPMTKRPEPPPGTIEVSFTADAHSPVTVSVGLPLFTPKPDSTTSPAQIGGDPAPASGELGLTLLYAD
jgi:hypothetical protein